MLRLWGKVVRIKATTTTQGFIPARRVSGEKGGAPFGAHRARWSHRPIAWIDLRSATLCRLKQ